MYRKLIRIRDKKQKAEIRKILNDLAFSIGIIEGAYIYRSLPENKENGGKK